MANKILFMGIFLCILFIGCAQQHTIPNQAADSNEQLAIAATFYPLYDLTRTVAGDAAQVVSVVPIEIEPHSFKETPQDIIKLSKSDAFVTLGTEFEAFEDRLIDAVADDLVIISAGKGIELIDIDEDEHDEHEEDHHEGEHDEGHDDHEDEHDEEHEDDHDEHEEGHDDHDEEHEDEHDEHEDEHDEHEEEHDEHDEEHEDEHEDEHGHHHSGVDPHIWLSPNNAIKMVDSIRDGLTRADSSNQEIYTLNAQNLKAELETLDNDFKQALSSCDKDTILVAHNAYSYLGRDYGFKTIEIAGLSPEAEPTPKQIATLIDEAQEHDLKYVFYEELVDPKVSQAIADQVGADVLPLYPVAYGKESDSYLSIMRENLNNLKLALECR